VCPAPQLPLGAAAQQPVAAGWRRADGAGARGRTISFQIWELLDAAADASQVITQATRETQPLREVVSVRHGPTRLVKMLASAPAARGADARPPALAVVAGEQPGDSNRVRIFSLMTHAYTDEMRFHGVRRALRPTPHALAHGMPRLVLR